MFTHAITMKSIDRQKLAMNRELAELNGHALTPFTFYSPCVTVPALGIEPLPDLMFVAHCRRCGKRFHPSLRQLDRGIHVPCTHHLVNA